MITIPATQFQQFQKAVWPAAKGNQRLGQAFHEYMKLEKLTDPEDVAWADKLYSAPDIIAANLIIDKLDWDN